VITEYTLVHAHIHINTHYSPAQAILVRIDPVGLDRF